MLYSQLFSKTTKQAPEGETAKNAELLIKAGFISKSSSGVYSLLPLGFRVLQNINSIIREEMNAIGAEEMIMPSLIHRSHWKRSGRWDVDVIYVAGDRNDIGKKNRDEFEYGLGWTHEEVIADIAHHMINSYKDLPKAVYQIQTKFRAEARAQAGLLRGREFLMKDLYSFHADKEDLDRFYQIVIEAYKKIFSRLSLPVLVTEAGGGQFTKEITHEFQVVSDAGEDTIHFCTICGFAQNKEIFDAQQHGSCDGVLQSARAIEVGNVFKLGTKYAESFDLRFRDAKGELKHAIMGSYGLGPTRTMGAIVEVMHDARGMVWPKAIAPFQVILIALNDDNKKIATQALRFYRELQKAKIQVLYDDRRGMGAGEKFGDADLLGIPHRIVVSEKTYPDYELKNRTETVAKIMTAKEIKTFLKKDNL